jgi:hypothetical protein
MSLHHLDHRCVDSTDKVGTRNHLLCPIFMQWDVGLDNGAA